MKIFSADLHIHTVLSPCGSLEMSPKAIVEKALAIKLDIIGITDHNSTRQCKVVKEIGEKAGLAVYCGAEITTKEEVHCLTFFENFEKLEIFQAFIDINLPNIKNDVDLFGHQVAVDASENIVYQEPRLLISAIEKSLESLSEVVHSLEGILIPAHIDRPKFSIYSQLGFIPDHLDADAFELLDIQFPAFQQYLKTHPKAANRIIQNSDAHTLQEIGSRNSKFKMLNCCFDEFRKALKNTGGRRILSV